MSQDHDQGRNDLFSRPPEPKIFISSEMRSGSLSRERLAAASAVEGTGHARAWYWERDAIAGPYSSESVCLGHARTSDGLILIVADKVTDIVKNEYLAAHRAGAPCFVFLKSGIDRDKEVKEFITNVRNQGHVTVPFDSVEDLSEKVSAAVLHQMTWSWREMTLTNRLRRSTVWSDRDSRGTQAGNGIAPTRSYEDVSIVADYQLSATASLSEVVEQVNTALETGYFRKAIDLVLGAAGQVGVYGFSDTVTELIDLVVNSVPRHVVERSESAWLLNLEGLALSHQGDRSQAVAKFLHMQKLGDELGDYAIVATALQNLAIQAHLDGDLETATELTRDALKRMLDIPDYRGALQVTINRVSIAADQGDLQLADQLLADVEPVLVAVQDDHLLCTFHGNRGILAVRRGDYQAAKEQFTRSLEHARKSGDWQAVLNNYRNLGNVNLETDNAFCALLWYRRALRAAEFIGVLPELRIAHASLAVALHKADRLPEAIRHFENARSYAARYGDRDTWARLTSDMGAMTLESGDPPASIKLLQEALEEFRRSGNRKWEALVLWNMVEAQAATGDGEGVTTAAEEALQVLPLDARDERARVLGRTAQLLLRLGNTEDGAVYFRRSLIELRNTSDQARLASESATAAVAMAEHGDISSALHFFDHSLETFENLGDCHGQYNVLSDRAIAFTQAERFEEARIAFESSAELAAQLDDNMLAIQTSLNRGEMERRAGQLESALSWLRGAVTTARQVGDKALEAEALANLGIALTNMGQWDKARIEFEAAQSLAKATGHPHAEATATGGLATIEFHDGKFTTAAELYRRASSLNEAVNDPARQLEDLAGLVECLAATGDVDGVAKEGQELVNLAQAIGNIRFAASALVRSAQRLADLQLFDDAAGAFAGAITGELVDWIEDQDEDSFGWSIFAMIETFTRVAPEKADAMYERVVSQISDQQGLSGTDLDSLRNLINDVRLIHKRVVSGSGLEDSLSETVDD